MSQSSVGDIYIRRLLDEIRTLTQRAVSAESLLEVEQLKNAVPVGEDGSEMYSPPGGEETVEVLTEPDEDRP